ncbi:hypothetical protein AB4Z48_27045 [Cupriavidus sp. 2TAF22]|uniref:hypothetical protein n=1 Tax=unclassified Cupriavidus TaxID=2640874 RepID=UPI003F93217B
MNYFLRFIKGFAKLFFAPVRRAYSNSTANLTFAPATLVPSALQPRFVLRRDRILRRAQLAGKTFLKISTNRSGDTMRIVIASTLRRFGPWPSIQNGTHASIPNSCQPGKQSTTACPPLWR